MKRFASSLIALSLAIAAGCSNGGSGGVIPQHNASFAPTRDADRANVSLRIRIQKHARKRAHYVSPATASATVKISPKAGCASCSPAQSFKVELVPSSSHCKSSAAALTCTISIELKGGSYTGSLMTFDASGATLSENQSFAVSITAGKANTIGVTLYGVPAALKAALVDPARGSQTYDGSGNETIDIAGANTQAQVFLTAVDADDYVIAGPGAPAVSASVSGSAGFSAAATPGSPNVATIRTPALRTNATDKLFVIANGPGCADPHAVCASSVTLGADTLVASAASGGAVEVETLQGNVVGSFALAPGSAPTSLAFDSHGHLFVAGSGMNVSEYAWPFNGAPVATFGKPTFGTACPGMVIDNKDDVIVGQLGGVSVYAPPYTGTPKSQGFVAPQCLALDASGYLYIITAYGGGLVIDVPPPFFSGAYNVVTSTGVPTALASDPVNDTVGVSENGTIYVYDDALTVVRSGSYIGTNGLLYGNGYFIAVASTSSGLFDAFNAADLSNAGFGQYGTTIGSATFDSRNDLLVSGASGIAVYNAPWNGRATSAIAASTSPAVAMATWP